MTVNDESLAALPLAAQQEMPFALVQGQPMTQLPLDLYIPPDALEVILEQFEGPLDLLLYLIRKQNLDILEVNVSEIVDQYLLYIDMMQTMQLELAGEYLVMAAMLAEIKSRVLLPRNQDPEAENDEDPRAELIRRLQEYERFKTAAEDMDALPRMERDTQQARLVVDNRMVERIHPDVDMRELMLAYADILRRAERREHHEIQREQLSTRERMSQVLERLQGSEFVVFGSLFDEAEGKLGVVVTFLAVLELVKEKLVELVQQQAFGLIYVRARQSQYETDDSD
ncbi:segregation and condensation protein A [Oceanobacter mangrovi]|uniref:segregation and condensation protein A n=1 Tax=Oceanobacter mangrovi TaxID=2862510 RepID=UPI001C8D31A2|nr:ScpA family protein [Oceanobacter mangrovi]